MKNSKKNFRSLLRGLRKLEFSCTIDLYEYREAKERDDAEDEEFDESGLYSKSTAQLERSVARKIYNALSVVTCIVICAVLLVTISLLPTFGSADDPANNEVAQKYLSDGIEDTGAVNAVAGMILDYRAFDTLGESFVLFTATCSVLILMRSGYSKKREETLSAENKLVDLGHDGIVSLGGISLVPAIVMFGIYIILNGHLSPGGGFSGGAVMGSAFIMYASIFGFERADKFLTPRLIKSVTCISLGFYCLAKSYSFFTGANDIESFIPKGIPGHILSAGLILPLDIAVGCVVACTMYSFYSLFRRGRA